ncbi:MAG: hypothetical protein WA326_10985 [Nitrososphaeraceae archaeon]|jgi:hypothetical protein
MELRCAAKQNVRFERPGPSVEAFLTLAELRYLQKGRGFFIRYLNLSKPQECELGSI